MKKKAIAVVVIVAVIVVSFGAVVAVRNSPEYALLNIAEDIQAAGIEGVKPHLTGDALRMMEKFEALSDNKFVNTITSVVDMNYYVDLLKEELAQVDWSLDEIEKHSGFAELSLEFNFKEKLTGVVEFVMEREEGDWRISEISLSDLDRP